MSQLNNLNKLAQKRAKPGIKWQEDKFGTNRNKIFC